MSASGPQLCLGTVQFGLAYGIAGRGERVGDLEARRILAQAWEAGIRRLDTAPGYGDIEQRLAGLIDGRAFEIVTKIPAMPSGADPVDFVNATLQRSLERLGDTICGVLFHAADDLAEPSGPAAWEAAARWCGDRSIPLGVSTYGPAELARFAQTHSVAMAQLPANAFDQRLADEPELLAGIEVTARSAFLQGLLLMDEVSGTARLPAAAKSLAGWHTFVRAQSLDPLTAALGVVKGIPAVDFCAVGVDSAEQLTQIAAAWHAARPITAPQLATDDPAVIDPRTWSRAA